jgi:hypothetical protein
MGGGYANSGWLSAPDNLVNARDDLCDVTSNSSRAALLDVKSMKYSMQHRGKKKAGDKDHQQSTIKSIAAGKELAGLSCGAVYRPHSPEEHGRVEKCICPSQALKVVIPDQADHEGDTDEQKCGSGT